MNEAFENDNRWPWYWKLLILLLIGGLLYAMTIPNFIRGGSTKRIGIIVNLHQIDGAKSEWAFEHVVTNLSQYTGQLLAKDLAPYILASSFDSNNVKHPIAGEIYTINSLDKLPEAKLTRKLEGLPKGTIITLGGIDDWFGKNVFPTNN